MDPAALILLIASLCALGFSAWRGRTPERIVAIALLIVMFGSPLLEHIHLGGVRIGVALLSLSLAVLLVVLCLVVERWWLIAAAGFQLVALASYGAALLDPDISLWASVTVRIGVWVQLMIVAVLGAIEARHAPYARPQSLPDGRIAPEFP